MTVDGESSAPTRVLLGVPQGSVIGPSLFLIYVNYLPNGIKSKVRLFADDTIMYLKGKGKEKALLLNTYFQSVFTRESPLSLKEHGQKAILDNTQEDSFQYPTMPEIIITRDGIIRLLKNLKSRKAAGPDDLVPAVLKELSTEIAPVLQKIYSKSIQTHIISTENYRPISLTCICSKILGHIITSCIMSHLEAKAPLIHYSMDSARTGPVSHSFLNSSQTLLTPLKTLSKPTSS